MNPLVSLANTVFETAEKTAVPHMAVGAIAAGVYGISRATQDIDVLVSVQESDGVQILIQALSQLAEFEQQAQFDTITWGRRTVGVTKKPPRFKIELFETFDDPFVIAEFERRQRIFVPLLNREIWVPTAEDVVVQKIRRARPKDLEDARDVLAVQDPANLDMAYIEKWCREHQTLPRLTAILDALPEF